MPSLLLLMLLMLMLMLLLLMLMLLMLMLMLLLLMLMRLLLALPPSQVAALVTALAPTGAGKGGSPSFEDHVSERRVLSRGPASPHDCLPRGHHCDGSHGRVSEQPQVHRAGPGGLR
jgi:hypothetical protein